MDMWCNAYIFATAHKFRTAINLGSSCDFPCFWENSSIYFGHLCSTLIMFAPKAIRKTSPSTPRGRLQAVKQTFADGSTYEGGYLNFKKHGKGAISFSNGETYHGHWVEGLKEGFGVYTWGDGSQYIGNWLLDRMSGAGVHVASNGSKYSGSWNDNLMHGSGTYDYDNGSLFKGEWCQG